MSKEQTVLLGDILRSMLSYIDTVAGRTGVFRNGPNYQGILSNIEDLENSALFDIPEVTGGLITKTEFKPGVGAISYVLDGKAFDSQDSTFLYRLLKGAHGKLDTLLEGKYSDDAPADAGESKSPGEQKIEKVFDEIRDRLASGAHSEIAGTARDRDEIYSYITGYVKYLMNQNKV